MSYGLPFYRFTVCAGGVQGRSPCSRPKSRSTCDRKRRKMKGFDTPDYGSDLNLHALTPRSAANGPGWRFVVHVQGCALRCPSCFNPHTHDFAPRRLVSPADLAERVLAQPDLEGVTISGGEPLHQISPLTRFLEILRARSGLSVIVFSGFTLDEAKALSGADRLLALVDILVDGRYVEALRCADGLRGSCNQRIHLLTDRYSPADLVPCGAAEVIVEPDGHLILTGFDPPALR